MKKLSIALLLSILLSLSTVLFPVAISAEESMIDPSTLGKEYVYLSDNGNDANNGKTADKAVLTWAKAVELLTDSKGGVILIPDIYTYLSTNTYYGPYLANASFVIMGAKTDGTSVFAHNRGNICLKNDTTFDNLIYRVGVTNGNLYARWNKVEFTETVKTELNGGAEATSANRSKTISIYGGETGKTGGKDQSTNLILNGGTFNWVVGGTQKGAGDQSFSINVTVGGNCHILNRIYLGNMGLASDIIPTAGMDLSANLTINGGKIDDAIYLGGCADNADTICWVSIPVNAKFMTTDIPTVYCSGTNGSTVNGAITIDLTELKTVDSDWANGKIQRQNQATGGVNILLYKEAETTEAPKETEAPKGTETNAPGTEEPKPSAETTGEEESAKETPNDSKEVTKEKEAVKTEETNAKKSGCGSTVTAFSVVLLVGCAVLLQKRKI